MSLPTVALGTRGTTEYRYAEMQTLLGPVTIGETGDNRYETLYGRPYAMVLDENRVVRLFRGAAEGGSFEEVTAGLPTSIFGPVQPDTARRFTMAFDQSARAIIAYEDEGIIKVTRWDTIEGAYIQNVSFAGVDPALLMDATVLQKLPQNVQDVVDAGIDVSLLLADGEGVSDQPNLIAVSDVVLFYVTTDRSQFSYRIQRDNYGTEYALHTFAEPVILDRVIALNNRYEALLSSADGEPLTADGATEALVSGIYVYAYILRPAFLSTALATFSGPTGGEYRVIVVVIETEDAAAFAYGPPLGGAYEEPIIFADDDDAASFAYSAPLGGTYEEVIITHADSDDTTVNVSGPTGGVYETP